MCSSSRLGIGGFRPRQGPYSDRRSFPNKKKVFFLLLYCLYLPLFLPLRPYIRKVVLIYDYGTCPDRFFPFLLRPFPTEGSMSKHHLGKKKSTFLRHFFLFFKKIQFCGKVGALGRNPVPTSIAHSIWQQSSFCDNKFFCGNKGEREGEIGSKVLLLPTLLFPSFFPLFSDPIKAPKGRRGGGAQKDRKLDRKRLSSSFFRGRLSEKAQKTNQQLRTYDEGRGKGRRVQNIGEEKYDQGFTNVCLEKSTYLTRKR